MYIRFIHRLFRSAATSITGYYWRSKPINTTYVYLVRCVLITSAAWCIALIYRQHGCINNNVKSIVSIATTFVACNVNSAVAVAWLLAAAWFQPVKHRHIVYISPCCYIWYRSMIHLLWLFPTWMRDRSSVYSFTCYRRYLSTRISANYHMFYMRSVYNLSVYNLYCLLNISYNFDNFEFIVNSMHIIASFIILRCMTAVVHIVV